MPKKDRRADIIMGRARINGFDTGRLSKRSGIALSTLYRRLKNPDGFTLWEIAQIDRLICFTDAEVLYLLRQEGSLR